MKPAKGQGIEAIAIKRATLADADKVRYRVYRAADDYIAVIAESALMAMKVSGISNPYRIMRDLPTEGIAIEAQKMAKVTPQDEQIMLPVKQQVDATRAFLKTELSDKPVEPIDARFVPMQIRDLERKAKPWIRVLTPDMVEQTLGKPKAPPVPPAPPAPPKPRMDDLPEASSPEAPAVDLVPEAVTEPEVSVPVAVEQAAAASSDPDGTLSPEEVERLLNS